MEQLFHQTKATSISVAQKSILNFKESHNLTTSAPLNFQIRIARNEDRECLLNFLREHFYPEEPLNLGSEAKEPEAADEQFMISNIKHGMSLVALKPLKYRQLIVGAALASPKDRHEADHLFEEAAKYGQKNKFGRVLNILACLERNANVFDHYNIECALHLQALGVHNKFRGHALGFRLMEEIINLTRKWNYPLLTADCTSIYSARVCQKLGMECVSRLRYEDYCDEEGKQIFKPPPPHEAIETYALRL